MRREDIRTLVQWHPSLATGDELVDGHHRELLRRLEALVGALEEARRDEIPRTFELLGDYVVDHFGAEERAMEERGYPGRNVHRAAHARFVREYAELRGLYEATGPSLAIAVKAATWIHGWLQRHLLGADRAFARFVGEAPE